MPSRFSSSFTFLKLFYDSFNLFFTRRFFLADQKYCGGGILRRGACVQRLNLVLVRKVVGDLLDVNACFADRITYKILEVRTGSIHNGFLERLFWCG